MQSMSFVMSPWGFMTESEAGSCRPSYWTTHLVPADAFTALRRGWPSGCAAEHQNINTAQTQQDPWDYLQGKQDRLLSLWKTETHRRQGNQCKLSKKMLCCTKQQFDSLQNGHEWSWFGRVTPETIFCNFGSSQWEKQMSLLKGRLWEEKTNLLIRIDRHTLYLQSCITIWVK